MAPRVKKTKEEILARKRELEKKRYERLKKDKEKIEQLKHKKKEYYIEKKAEGKIKPIKQQTPRNQRSIRKRWRDNTAKYRARKKQIQRQTEAFVQETTPSSSDNETNSRRNTISSPNILDNGRFIDIATPKTIDKRAVEARKRAIRNRKLRLQDMKLKDIQINKLKQQLKNCQKAYSKLKNKKVTPKKMVEAVIKKADSGEIKKKLLFAEVMKKQISENYSKMKTQRERKVFTRAITGNIVKKYKVLSKNNIIPEKRERYKETANILDLTRKKRLELQSTEIKNKIANFLEDDSNSRMCSGKKETVTKNKEKRQKRYLLKPLKKLHQIFVEEYDNVSYSLFCKNRPYWIVKPKVQDRDTCLCTKHANFELLIIGLNKYGIIKESNTDVVLEKICCNKYNETCLSRQCQVCRNWVIDYQEFNNNVPITYFKWEYVYEEVFIKRTKCNRLVKKIAKVSHTEKPYNVVMEFEAMVLTFLNHHLNIVHQYAAMKKCKENLTETDVLVHVDFSENYGTKCSEEVQANHFGGSRNQFCLHTGVIYYKMESKVKCQSFCTISAILDHDVNAIWAHLQPIFDWISLNLKSVRNLHFLSDGPVTQYRNQFMFSTLANRLKYFFEKINLFTWNYSEAGHGKGAPDGIGAVCKRTADDMVAMGEDVVNINNLKMLLVENCPSVKIFVINNNDFEHAQIKLVGKPSRPFKGTLKVHQVVGDTQNGFKITMKKLSCFCENMFSCEHYILKTIDYADDYHKNLPERKQIYSSDSELEDNETENGNPNLQIDSQVAGPSHYVHDMGYRNGDYVLVRFKDTHNNTEYKYAGMCMGDIDEEQEIKVTFLKITSKDGKLFKIDDNLYDVPIDDILKKLPQPTLCLKGERVFYKFPNTVDVFEK